MGTTLTGKITEYFTYFCPNQSGEYTFTVQLMNLYYLWISNDNAFYDYSTNNADIDKNTLSILGGARSSHLKTSQIARERELMKRVKTLN